MRTNLPPSTLVKATQPATKRAAKSRAKRAAVLVEYTAILVLVAVPTVTAVMYAGNKLIQHYQMGRNHILRSMP